MEEQTLKQRLQLKSKVEQLSWEVKYLAIQIQNCMKEQSSNDELKHQILIDILNLRQKEQQILIEINNCLDQQDCIKQKMLKNNQQFDQSIQSQKQQLMKLNLILYKIENQLQANQNTQKQQDVFISNAQQLQLEEQELNFLLDQLGKLDIKLSFQLVEEQQEQNNLQNLSSKVQYLTTKINLLEENQNNIQTQLQKINQQENTIQEQQGQMTKELNQLNKNIINTKTREYFEYNKNLELQNEKLTLMRYFNHENIKLIDKKFDKTQQPECQNQSKVNQIDFDQTQNNQKLSESKNNQIIPFQNKESDLECQSDQMTCDDTSFNEHDKDLRISHQDQIDISKHQFDLEQCIISKQQSELKLQSIRQELNEIQIQQQTLQQKIDLNNLELNKLNSINQELQNKYLIFNNLRQSCINEKEKVELKINAILNKEIPQKSTLLEQRNSTKLKLENQATLLQQQKLVVNHQILNLLSNQQQNLLLQVDFNSISKQKEMIISKIQKLKNRLNIQTIDQNLQITSNNDCLNKLYEELQKNQQQIEESLQKNILFNQVRQDINARIQNLTQKQVTISEEIRYKQNLINEQDKLILQEIDFDLINLNI